MSPVTPPPPGYATEICKPIKTKTTFYERTIYYFACQTKNRNKCRYSSKLYSVRYVNGTIHNMFIIYIKFFEIMPCIKSLIKIVCAKISKWTRTNVTLHRINPFSFNHILILLQFLYDGWVLKPNRYIVKYVSSKINQPCTQYKIIHKYPSYFQSFRNKIYRA